MKRNVNIEDIMFLLFIIVLIFGFAVPVSVFIWKLALT